MLNEIELTVLIGRAWKEGSAEAFPVDTKKLTKLINELLAKKAGKQ